MLDLDSFSLAVTMAVTALGLALLAAVLYSSHRVRLECVCV